MRPTTNSLRSWSSLKALSLGSFIGRMTPEGAQFSSIWPAELKLN